MIFDPHAHVGSNLGRQTRFHSRQLARKADALLAPFQRPVRLPSREIKHAARNGRLLTAKELVFVFEAFQLVRAGRFRLDELAQF